MTSQKIYKIKPEYCKHIPRDLEEGVLYISKEFKVAIHLCACGCKEQTVTPLGAGEWNLKDNENGVTLRPSIGNLKGEIPYHAHYYITNNSIDWL